MIANAERVIVRHAQRLSFLGRAAAVGKNYRVSEFGRTRVRPTRLQSPDPSR